MPVSESYNKIVEAFHDSYLIKDEGIIKLLLATIIANRLPKAPVWLMLVAGSGTGKTEFIMALEKVRGFTPISEITANTFISGMKKNDMETSLLATLNRGDFMVFKDFTTALNMQKDVRNIVMAQLREIYDGSITKRFGNGLNITLEPKLGFIGGVTTAIYTSKRSYAAMGERFLMYCFKQPDRREAGMKALDNAEKDMAAKRIHLQELIRKYLDEEIKIPKELPHIHKNFKEKLVLLSDISTRASSVVERSLYGKQEIEYVHDLVGLGRFCHELMSLCNSFAIMNNSDIEDLDKHIIYKLGMDSIDTNRRLVLLLLTKFSIAATASVATNLNLPTGVVHHWLEDLNALDLVDRIKGGKADRWQLKNEYRKILSEFAEIPMLTDELLNKDREDEDEPPLATLEDLSPEETAALQGTLGIAGPEDVI
jgi:hypothetical protein